ncbi:electron transport complex subunit RsxG [Marinobacter sp. X15-166B]|uniref:electron transport complex subunit RsxG n=1 Tax=Marinobacter sp. X15-166B TaxID=1897620 RepID=UPI00085CCEC7|nr:electron transport complex subunit RsxG [Marinobacter sp. X15-166B]OEY67807.1 electron transporter RnfG [Marinobacter sp. X15-166B]
MAALGHSIRNSAIGLGLFAMITGGTIAVTQALTAHRIQQQVELAEARALFEIIPQSAHSNDLLADTLTLPAEPALGVQNPTTVWVARQNGAPAGLIVPMVAPDGYSGDIHLLVGIAPNGDILGVRITTHKETPGLGDKVELKKSDWVLDFNGHSLRSLPAEQWTVTKDGGEFDQFTGATITPRAVTHTVKRALEYTRRNQGLIQRTWQQTPAGEQV